MILNDSQKSRKMVEHEFMWIWIHLQRLTFGMHEPFFIKDFFARQTFFLQTKTQECLWNENVYQLMQNCIFLSFFSFLPFGLDDSVNRMCWYICSPYRFAT